jgi:hypothetical protein
MRFLKTEDLNKPLPISIGLSGGSGTGKTYSALRLARGIAAELAGPGAPFAYADTENRRALHYRETFPEMLDHYVDLGPDDENGKLAGYPPERGIELLDFIEASGAKALVLDSMSHFWEGIGGVLDLQSEVLAAMGGGDQASLRAWARVKPRYRKLVNRIIQSSIPTIICTRAKPVIPDPKRPGKNLMPTKTRRDDVPWDVAADKYLPRCRRKPGARWLGGRTTRRAQPRVKRSWTRRARSPAKAAPRWRHGGRPYPATSRRSYSRSAPS